MWVVAMSDELGASIRYRFNKYLLFVPDYDGNWLLYNPIHQQVLKIDDEMKIFIENLAKQKNINISLGRVDNKINKLLKTGVIIRYDFDEIEYVVNKYYKEHPSPYTLYVEFIMSWSCNFACIYCYENRIKKSMWGNTLKLGHISKAFEFIDKKMDSDMKLSVDLTGGEPLLISSFPQVQYILNETKKRDGKVYISTNGYTLDIYSDLLNKYQSVISLIRITLDGVKKIHDKRRPLQGGMGTFDKIVENINLLLKKYPYLKTKLAVNTIVDESSVSYVDEYLDYIEKEGWYGKIGLGIGPVGSYGNHGLFPNRKEIFNKLVDIFYKKKNLCKLKYISIDDGIGSTKIANVLIMQRRLPLIAPYRCQAFSPFDNSFVFSPDGYIYRCSLFAENKILPIGKYYPTIEEYHNNLKDIQKRNLLNLSKKYDEKLLPLNSGGCPFRSMSYKKMNDWINKKLTLLDVVEFVDEETIIKTAKLYIDYLKNCRGSVENLEIANGS